MCNRLRLLFAVAGLLAAAGIVAADSAPPANDTAAPPASSAAQAPEMLQEVTVTAQHLNLDWVQRNQLVQKWTTFVYGVAGVENGAIVPRWSVPVCPLVTGLPREQGEFILGRVSEIVRDAGARLAGEPCHPNLFILVTPHPKELLQAMEDRHFGVVFGSATPSRVDAFINTPAPIKVWHNSWEPAPNVWVFGPVYVVADEMQLLGLSQGQFADYVGMVSLAEIRTPAHIGDAPTILRLFEGPPQASPEGLSPWDQAFLHMLYTHSPSLAKERNNIARRMVKAVVP